MLAPIRSILSDVASGSIKDAKIVQLAGKVERLTILLSVAQEALTDRDAKISDLEAQVKILQPPDRIEEEAERVLNYIYDRSSVFSRKNVSNHCVNVLLVRDFIKVVGRHASAGDVMEITPEECVTPKHTDEAGRTRRDTATPISRPVYMLSRSFNLNPVIDARPS